MPETSQFFFYPQGGQGGWVNGWAAGGPVFLKSAFSVLFMELPWKVHVQNMGRTCSAYILPMFCPCSAHVLPMFCACSFHGISMNNLLSYCGLVDANKCFRKRITCKANCSYLQIYAFMSTANLSFFLQDFLVASSTAFFHLPPSNQHHWWAHTPSYYYFIGLEYFLKSRMNFYGSMLMLHEKRKNSIIASIQLIGWSTDDRK